MIAGSPLNRKLIRELKGTRRRLSDVLEDLGIDYDDVMYDGGIGLDQCSHCNIWSTQLVPDLDDNPVCPTCVTLTGL